MSSRVDNIRLKIERAKKHINDLQIEINAFLNTKPYVISTKQNPQTRQLIYYISSVKDVPSQVALIAGDCLQNIRSALDHLAWQLVESNGQKPTTSTCFPIHDDAAKYKSRYMGQVRGMSNAAINAINAIKPYKGGNDVLWKIHKLNNVDKHRLLITVGSAFGSLDLGAHLIREMAEKFPDLAIPDLHVFFRPAYRLLPLGAGNELFIDAPDAKVNEKLQFRFEVAFRELQVIEGDRLLKRSTNFLKSLIT